MFMFVLTILLFIILLPFRVPRKLYITRAFSFVFRKVCVLENVVENLPKISLLLFVKTVLLLDHPVLINYICNLCVNGKLLFLHSIFLKKVILMLISWYSTQCNVKYMSYYVLKTKEACIEIQQRNYKNIRIKRKLFLILFF